MLPPTALLVNECRSTRMTASPKIWVTFLLDFGHELTGEGKGKVVYIEQEKSLYWLLKAARLLAPSIRIIYRD
jgi:hypothetical protein